MIDLETASEDFREACSRLAKAEPIYRDLDLHTKTVYGQCFLKYEGGVKEREMKAFADTDYEAHLKELAIAYGDYLVARRQYDAAQARFECARTQTTLRRVSIEKGLFESGS